MLFGTDLEDHVDTVNRVRRRFRRDVTDPGGGGPLRHLGSLLAAHARHGAGLPGNFVPKLSDLFGSSAGDFSYLDK